MPDPVKEIAEMFRAELLALAFLGALVALSFWAPADRRTAIINVMAGTIISGASAPGIYAIVLWKWPEFPAEISILGALYFWLGLLGMRLVPVAASLIDRLRGAKIPGVDKE